MTAVVRPRGALVALAVAFIVLGAVDSLATPVFEAPDEVWHTAYVRYVAMRGSLPVQGAGWGEQAARQEASQPPLYYLLAAPLISWIDTGDFDRVARLNPHAQPGQPGSDGNKNMVVPTPTTLPWTGTALAVHLMRGFSLLLGLATVLATYALGVSLFGVRRFRRRTQPGDDGIVALQTALPLVLAAFVAFNPQFLFISASVNNDNLMSALAAVALALVARTAVEDTPVSSRRALLLGVITGLGAITKLTGVLLLGFVALALLLLAWRRWGRAALPSIALMLLAAGVVAGWWYARNWLLYGDLTGLSGMLAVVGQRRLTLAQLLAEAQGLELSFWGVFGWFNVLMDEWIYTALKIAARLAALGLLLLLVRALATRRTVRAFTASESARFPRSSEFLSHVPDPTVLALCAPWAAIVVGGLVRWTATTPGTQGRLLFPAIGALAALLLYGLAALIPQRLRVAALALAAGGLLALAVAVPFRYIIPAYARPPLMSIEQAQSQNPVHLRYGNGEIELVGYSIDAGTASPGRQVTLTLYLQALHPIAQDYSLFIHLWGSSMEWLGQRDSYPGRGSLPASQMTPGQVVADRYLVSIAPTATVPARVQIEAGFYDYDSGQRLPVTNADGTSSTFPVIGRFKLDSPNPAGRTLRPALFSFGDQARLVAQRVQVPPLVQARSVISVTTEWQATAAMRQDYTIFLQVVDDTPSVVAQNDGPPQAGEYPTGLWDVGEVVSDQRTLSLPASLPSGHYRIVTGLYLLATNERLPARGPNGPVPENWAVIGEFTVP